MEKILVGSFLLFSCLQGLFLYSHQKEILHKTKFGTFEYTILLIGVISSLMLLHNRSLKVYLCITYGIYIVLFYLFIVLRNKQDHRVNVRKEILSLLFCTLFLIGCIVISTLV